MASFGRSKYTKMMVFHKAATLLNDESEMSSEKEPELTISGSLSPAHGPESRAAIESIDASDENSTILQEEGSNESEIDNLLSNLTLQDPSLERVIQKLTRKERREKLYQELLDISDTDSDDEDDDLIDNTGDYENDFILSDEELVEDVDETAAMLDYIENAKLDDDGQLQLQKYYQDLAQKLSAFDKKLASEESKERKAKGKARAKTSVDTKEAPVDTKESKGKRVRAQADQPNGSSGNVQLDMGESEVLLEPYSDEELHIVTSAMSAARRNGYTESESEGSESEVNDSEDGDNEDVKSEDIEILDDGNEGDLFEEALSEEESDAEEEEIDDELYEEDEDDSEDIEFESDDDEEDEEGYLANENDDDEPVVIYEEEEVSIIVDAVPPSLQRGTLHFPFECVTSFNPVCKPCELNRLQSNTDFQ